MLKSKMAGALALLVIAALLFLLLRENERSNALQTRLDALQTRFDSFHYEKANVITELEYEVNRLEQGLADTTEQCQAYLAAKNEEIGQIGGRLQKKTDEIGALYGKLSEKLEKFHGLLQLKRAEIGSLQAELAQASAQLAVAKQKNEWLSSQVEAGKKKITRLKGSLSQLERQKKHLLEAIRTQTADGPVPAAIDAPPTAV